MIVAARIIGLKPIVPELDEGCSLLLMVVAANALGCNPLLIKGCSPFWLPLR